MTLYDVGYHCSQSGLVVQPVYPHIFLCTPACLLAGLCETPLALCERCSAIDKTSLRYQQWSQIQKIEAKCYYEKNFNSLPAKTRTIFWPENVTIAHPECPVKFLYHLEGSYFDDSLQLYSWVWLSWWIGGQSLHKRKKFLSLGRQVTKTECSASPPSPAQPDLLQPLGASCFLIFIENQYPSWHKQ